MFHQFKIGSRLLAGFCGVLAILCLLAITAAVRINAIGATVDRVVALGDEGTNAGLMRASVNSRIGLTKDLAMAATPEEVAKVEKKFAEEAAKYESASQRVDALLKLAPPAPEQAATLADARRLGVPGAAAVAHVLQVARSGDRGQVKTELPGTVDALQAWRLRLNDLVKLQAGLNDAAAVSARDSLRASLVAIGAVALLGLLLGTVLAALIARSIVRPLGQALMLARSVAEGRLDVRVPAVQGQDETAELLRALATMHDSLRSTVHNVGVNAEALGRAARTLGDEARTTDQTAADQARDVAGAAAAVEELTRSIEHISGSASELRAASEAVMAATEGSTATMDRLGREIGLVQSTVGEIGTAVEGFVTHTAEITGMTREVKELADQTNLLALNAAIEAARAGELGRGFAVVADEVRKLAEHSAQAASRIDQVTRALQDQSASVQSSLLRSRAALDSSTGCTGDLSRQFEQSRAAVERTHAGVQAIVGAAEQQASSSRQLGDATVTAARSAERQRTAASAVHLAAQALESLSGEMQQGVGRFRL